MTKLKIFEVLEDVCMVFWKFVQTKW